MAEGVVTILKVDKRDLKGKLVHKIVKYLCWLRYENSKKKKHWTIGRFDAKYGDHIRGS